MTPQEAQAVHGLLMKRVKPIDAEEGMAIAILANKVVSHFAPKAPPSQDAQQPTAGNTNGN